MSTDQKKKKTILLLEIYLKIRKEQVQEDSGFPQATWKCPSDLVRDPFNSLLNSR